MRILAEDGFIDGGERYSDEELKLFNSELCPVCDSDNVPMGKLGQLTWYRCQSCGMEYNTREE